MKEKNDLFVATNVEKREGFEPEFFVLGVYDTPDKARKCLEEQFEQDSDELDDDDFREQWTRTDIEDGLGSFRYVYDEYSYFEYIVQKTQFNK